ncbi:chymotrypsin inhibitor [Apis mellifera]|uniref:Chymotrypsin inhibitor n=1 Tax=Apis mellifera TaxID=7460 RepID=A0A7M7GAF4_APIME|nr:chymotrypsin inhibitor [Apis mellifera]|eukprot:XP_003250085.1 chymotrypsin inhibitor [Apis mellifera]
MNTFNMSRILLTLLVILAIFSSSTLAKGICRENEEWQSCGTACQPSCSNPTPICTLQCVPSCQCESGLLRNENKQCIEPSEC